MNKENRNKKILEIANFLRTENSWSAANCSDCPCKLDYSILTHRTECVFIRDGRNITYNHHASMFERPKVCPIPSENNNEGWRGDVNVELLSKNSIVKIIESKGLVICWI